MRLGVMRTTALLTALFLLHVFAAGAVGREHNLILVDPSASLEENWDHQGFGKNTEYSLTKMDGIQCIRAVGQNSASGLYRDSKFSLADYGWLEWAWRVEKVQNTADIRIKAGDDMAAAIFLFFGQPSWLNRHVPTLAYVWTNDKLAKGSVVLNPYHPGTTREIVLESGIENIGRWVHVRRNIADDYFTAFGEKPTGDIEMIAIWSDSDQTGELVEACYGAVHALRE